MSAPPRSIPSEAVEEKVSLSDRFGLWLGFHNCGQDEYLAMIDAYAAHFGLKIEPEELRRRALAWAMGRGARSGRVAWQFIQDLAGELGNDRVELASGDSRRPLQQTDSARIDRLRAVADLEMQLRLA